MTKYKKIFITAIMAFPINAFISYIFTIIHSNNIIYLFMNSIEIAALSVIFHALIIKLRFPLAFWVALVGILIFLAIPSMWIVAMSYGWGDSIILNEYAISLFPIWMLGPIISKLIDLNNESKEN